MLGTSELIGVDIGQYAIKFARVKKSGGSFICNFLAYDIIPEEIRESKNHEALKGFVSDLIKQYKLTKLQPVIHVNAGDTIMRRVEVAAEFSGDALEGAIEFDLAPALPFGIDEVYFDFEETPDENNTHLTIAARRDLVDSRTELLQSSAKKKTTVQVDVDVFAYERLISQLQGTDIAQEDSLMLIDIGCRRCRMIAFNEQKYIFHREQQNTDQQAIEAYGVNNIDIENSGTYEEYQQSVLEPYAISLADQINLAIDFYEASGSEAVPIEKLYITGGGAYLQGLLEALQNHMTLPVDLLNLSDHIKIQTGQDEVLQNGLNHALAIGLAMEGK